MALTDLVFALAQAPDADLVFGGVTRITDLVFAQPSATHPTDLVFGGDAREVHTDATFDISATLPALQGTLSVALGVRMVLAGLLPGLSGGLAVIHDNQTQRPTVAHCQTFAQVAAPAESGLTQPQQHAQPARSGVQHQALEAVYAHVGNTPTFATALPANTLTNSQFQDGTQASARLLGQWQDGNPEPRVDLNSPFKDGTPARSRLHGRFEDGLHDRRHSHTDRWQESATHRKGYTGRAGPAQARPLYRDSRFQNAWVPRPGQYVRPTIPVTPSPYFGPALVFACPPLELPNLVFGRMQCASALLGGASLYILPARYYMTAHTVIAHRLPDMADIPIYAATVSADTGSYCWSLSANGPSSLFDLLAPVAGLPAQLQVTLDGIPFVFAVDALSRSAAFGQTGVLIQGRSVTALIGAPYMVSQSRIEPLDRTAQQLALNALDLTGIDLDWGIGAGALANGGLEEWFVPAGAYSRQGTPLESVIRIAQAAGGYLQSHRSAATLLVRHPYGMRTGDVSGAPWDWSLGAADVELAQDAIITEAIERKDGADINAVYVSGTSAGVLALVKRAGTAGDKLASMVADSLITHTDAARQRGLAVLGAAGNKYNVRLDLPVLTGAGQPGVLDVGQLVQVNAPTPWRGRVRAVSVNATYPSLRQSVTLERHLA